MHWPFARTQAPAADAPPPMAALPPRRTDWAGLPAIQRSVGPAPLTMQPSFGDQLASHPPAPALQPLGHHFSPQAAPGLVVAVATPQPSPRQSPAMIHRPRVQRKAAGAETEPEETDAAVATPEGPPTAMEAPVAVQSLEVQRLSRVDASPMVQPVASSAIRIAPPPAPVTPASPVGGVVVARTADGTEGSPAAPRMTLGQVRRIGLGAPLAHAPVQRKDADADEPAMPVARSHSTTSARAETEPAPAASPPPPAAVSLASSSLHPAGRVVLPLVRTVQRTAAAESNGAETEASEPAPDEAAPDEPAGTAQLLEAGGDRPRALPPAPVQRLTSVVETVLPGQHPMTPLELPLAPRASQPEALSGAHVSAAESAGGPAASGPSLQRSAVDESDSPAGGRAEESHEPVASTQGAAMPAPPQPADQADPALTVSELSLVREAGDHSSSPAVRTGALSLPLAARAMERASAVSAAPLQRTEALPTAPQRRLAEPIARLGLGTPLAPRPAGAFDDRPAIQRQAADLPLQRQGAAASAVALHEVQAPSAVAGGDSPSILPLQRAGAASFAPLDLPLAAAPRPRSAPDLTVARQVAGELVASGMAAPDGDGGLRFQTPAGASAPITAQRVGEEASASAPASSSVSSSTAAPGSSPAGASPSVQQVADEVLRRLRRELLVQRERSGKYHDDVS